MINNKYSANTKIMSFLLGLVTVFGAFSLAVLPAYADDTEPEPTGTEEVVDPDTDTSTDGETEEETETQYLTIEEAIEAYLTTEYASREEKIQSMQKKLTKGDYELYCDSYTGEVAVKNVVTGQILLSNPFDVALVSADSVKSQLLSQVVVSFQDLKNNDATRVLYSYADSATYGQIAVKNIKNGIRVEYTVGKEASKKLMPYWIEASRFETMILKNISGIEIAADYAGDGSDLEKSVNSYQLGKTISSYTRQDANDTENQVDTVIKEILATYTCTKSTYAGLGITPMSTKTTTDEEGNTVYVTEYLDHTGKLVKHEYKMSDHLVIYTVNTQVTASEKMSNTIEGYVKEFCPDYNYEERDYDIELTGYVGDEAANATFNLALEYYLTDKGFSVSLPANGIRYDSDAYRLNYISVLPYMGASNGNYEGYTFIPDGSGTIIRNEDIMSEASEYTVTGQVYGADYAYHTISYNGKSEVMRMPVFGVIDSMGTEYIDGYDTEYQVDSTTGEYIYDLLGNLIAVQWSVEEDEVKEIVDEFGDHVKYVLAEDETKELMKKATGYFVLDENGNIASKSTPIYGYTSEPQGYFAIIEEGESLCTITAKLGGGQLHPYSTAYVSFYPESSDSYNLAEASSVGQDAEWTVVSERKYTGLLKINYIMLSDYEGSAYEGTYVGMAKAYRDYLETNGIISLIDTKAADIPLYIESFGMIETQDIVMTIPVWVDTAITSFENVSDMYNTLVANGITNVNFRLTGFNDGGTEDPTPVSKVKFERVLGGNSGYVDLLADAEGKFGVYPDFDFANAHGSAAFDGFSYSSDTVRTIDDRYASKREYDAVYQSFRRAGAVPVSPCAYEKIFGKFASVMDELGANAVSVSTLGTDLSSDFDEDDPYNREDNKQLTMQLLASLDEHYGNVMIDGGNAYTWGYVDHILNVSLDGSRYLRASQSIPFMGLVLHGYINIAGKPTNMQGDVDYEILKIIENGASPYYTLSYQNTEELKESGAFNKYYSVDFKIWLDELVSTYSIINFALHDVQTSRIADHQFVFGNRILTEDEQAEYDAELAAAQEAYQTAYNDALVKAIKDEINNGTLIVSDDYSFEPDESGRITVPEGFDIESFEFEDFEEYYVASMDVVIDDYTIVYEIYENGIALIINYNNFDVTVEINGMTYTVGAYDFTKIDASGNVVEMQ